MLPKDSTHQLTKISIFSDIHKKREIADPLLQEKYVNTNYLAFGVGYTHLWLVKQYPWVICLCVKLQDIDSSSFFFFFPSKWFKINGRSDLDLQYFF